MTDPNQGASLNFKAGYRNLFRLFDTTTFEINKSISEKKNSINIKIDFPISLMESDSQIGYCSENRTIFKSL